MTYHDISTDISIAWWLNSSKHVKGAPLKCIEFAARPGRPHPVVKIYPTWSFHVIPCHVFTHSFGCFRIGILVDVAEIFMKIPICLMIMFDDSLPNSCWWKKVFIPGSDRPKKIKARTFAGVTSQQRSGNLPQTKIKAKMVVKASNAVEKKCFNQQKREITIYKCDLRSPQP